MSLVYESRISDSPYIETVTCGRTVGDGSTIRPAETNWHMVFTRYEGKLYPLVVGPLTASGTVHFTEGAEIIWIRFKLGSFMPHLPTHKLLDQRRFCPERRAVPSGSKARPGSFPISKMSKPLSHVSCMTKSCAAIRSSTPP